jgi:cytochrome c-type biogenesis protein CcmH/NrfG
VDPEKEYAEASALYGAGDMAGARAKLEAMLATNPGHWQGWQLLGNARYGLGDKAAAVEAYRKSLELNPANEDLMKWVDSLAPGRP